MPQQDLRHLCQDAPGWNNGPRAGGSLTCNTYVAQGHCAKGGFVPGHEWAGGASYNFPEMACCACGRRKVPPQDHARTGTGKSTMAIGSVQASQHCHCPGVSVCSNYSLAAFMLRMPSHVRDRSSPWYSYLGSVYRSETLPLPLDLAPFEAEYSDLHDFISDLFGQPWQAWTLCCSRCKLSRTRRG